MSHRILHGLGFQYKQVRAGLSRIRQDLAGVPILREVEPEGSLRTVVKGPTRRGPMFYLPPGQPPLASDG